MSNPSSYGIKLPDIKNKPYVNLVNIEYPIDFYTFSIISNVSEEELYHLNPGFSTWYFLPSFQDRIFLPSSKIKEFKKRYKKVTKFIFSKKTHLIVKGDSLSHISRKYNVSIKAIKKINNLKSDVIILGKKLKLPKNTALSDVDSIKIDGKKYIISQKSFKYNHIVKRYDNWYKIARMYNVSLSKLLKWNKATKKTSLKVSNKVIIMMQTPILSLTNEVKLRYVVNNGDTTAIVSTGFGISKKKLMETNQIKNSKYLTAGKNLKITLK
jgi:membrane-bound lytic murein transglycosylase D